MMKIIILALILNDYDDIHIKNLKGIIYNDLGFSLPDDEYKFVVMSDCGKECNGDDSYSM